MKLGLAVAIVLLQGFAAQAAEIKLLSAGGIRQPLEQLIPQFERASGHKVAAQFMGGPAVKTQIEGGAAFDVTVAGSNVIDELVKAGKLAAASRAEVARAGVGIAVRTGARKPDISSPDALKRALLNAKSVAYAKDGTGGMHFDSVLQRLGIAKEMQPKLQLTAAANPADGATTRVARGDAEIAVATVSSLYAPGVDVVGPLPADLQMYIHFAAAMSARTKEGEAAAAFIRLLAAPEAASAYKARGMEPAPQR